MAHADYGERVRGTARRGLNMVNNLASNTAGLVTSAGDTTRRVSRQIWSQAGDVADDLEAAGRAGVGMVKRNREVAVLSICAAAAIGYFAYLVLRASNSPRRPGRSSATRVRQRSPRRRPPR
jgi:hypothetical protein